MKLKNKILIVSIISIIIFCIFTLILQKYHIMLTYGKIEQSEAGKDMCQAYDIINKTIKCLKNSAENIADSKELLRLITNKNNINLTNDKKENLFNITKSKLILVYNSEKKLIYSQIEPKFEKEFDLDKILTAFSENDLIYSNNNNASSYAGLTVLPSSEIILAASASVLNPATKHIEGTVITILPINNLFIRDISDRVKSPVRIFELNSLEKLPLNEEILRSLKKNPSFYFEAPNFYSNFSACYMVLKDIKGKPAFLLTTWLSRSIYLEAHSMIELIVYTFIIFGVLLIFITTNIIQRVVVNPVSKLTKAIVEIRKSENLSKRTEFVTRKDEIGILSFEFNSLLEQLQHHIEDMEEIIREKTKEIKATREDTIFRLSMAIDDKDAGAGSHIKCIQKMVELLAYKLNYRKTKCEMLGIAATLHDIGKIGIPEYILDKTGKYTEEEYNIMKIHTVIGGKIFSGSDSELIETARQIALYHHERWDGKGYPEKLKEKDIPMPARIMTIIDVFNGMLAHRTYKKQFSLQEVIQYFNENSGIIFDPDIVKVFIENINEFEELRQIYFIKL